MAAEAVAHYGAAIYLGKAENTTAEQIALQLKNLLEDKKIIFQLGTKVMRLVDGRGVLRAQGKN